MVDRWLAAAIVQYRVTAVDLYGAEGVPSSATARLDPLRDCIGRAAE